MRHVRLGVSLLVVLLATGALLAIVNTPASLRQIDVVHDEAAEHVSQEELRGLAAAGQGAAAFQQAFEEGDELFETFFNALDGGGANVGNGARYTRVPRADLRGPGEWFNHRPIRVTGPNGTACNACHLRPFDDGAGEAAANVHRDTFRTGLVSQFVQRNTPHLFAPGAIQRLAEEMTDDLKADLGRLRARACAQRGVQHAEALDSKGIGFGVLRASGSGSPCVVTFNTDGVQGVDFAPNPQSPAPNEPDLVIKPFQWKGSVAFLRDFNRGASHNELGVQAVEIAGDGVDGDFDGVVDEMTIGDQTALAVYIAAQPRPTSLLELDRLGLIEPLPSAQKSAILRGRQVFDEIGCDTCHRPSLTIDRPIFSEPSQSAFYRDKLFPAGQDPMARGVDPRFAVRFDLTRQQPDNVLRNSSGGVVFRLGSLERDRFGRGVVELYGDLKRHEMGPRLTEPVNEIAGDDTSPNPAAPLNRHTPSKFLTENLWGVGGTAPYMHDGRATTLGEAILEHATDSRDDPSEAKASRLAYLRRSDHDKRAVVAFLSNLVLFKIEEEEEPETGQVTQTVKVRPSGARLRRQ
jgi:hypothetical protein